MGQGSALSLRQRPCFSQHSRAIYVPRCPNEEWTPLFLSSDWYFNGILTGNRSEGAICLFFFFSFLKETAEVHMGVWLKGSTG